MQEVDSENKVRNTHRMAWLSRFHSKNRLSCARSSVVLCERQMIHTAQALPLSIT